MSTLPRLPPPAAIATDRMWQLVTAGAAQPLIPGHFPVPVWYAGWWWHVPQLAAPHRAAGGEQFVPAPAAMAARFAELATRAAGARRPPRPRR